MRKRESLSNNQHILNIKISTCYETVHCTVSPKFTNEFGATCLLCFAQFTLVRFSVLYIKKGETRPSKAKAFFGTHAGTETVHRTVSILQIALFDSLFFTSKKEVSKNDTSFFGAEGETRTLAPVTRPTPLAGAPRHQLEYFCKLTG